MTYVFSVLVEVEARNLEEAQRDLEIDMAITNSQGAQTNHSLISFRPGSTKLVCSQEK